MLSRQPGLRPSRTSGLGPRCVGVLAPAPISLALPHQHSPRQGLVGPCRAASGDGDAAEPAEAAPRARRARGPASRSRSRSRSKGSDQSVRKLSPAVAQFLELSRSPQLTEEQLKAWALAAGSTFVHPLSWIARHVYNVFNDMFLSVGHVRISYFPDCGWTCEHQGPCCAPAPVPCDRLPCDERCSELLSCGHRCPGLCGEPCPPAHFCVQPDCAAKTPVRVAEQVVDLVSLTPFSSLSDAAVDADPLVALPCGHAYTASTLDAWLDMETRFYNRAPPEGDRPGRWLGLRPLPTADQDELKGCPECREPIQGVRRYGRATHKAAIDVIDRMMATAAAVRLGQAENRMKAIEGQPGEWRLEPTEDKKGRATLKPSTLPLLTALQGAEWEAASYLHLSKLLRRGPKQQVYEKAVASARDLVAAEEARRESEASSSPSAAAGSTGGRPGASVAEAPAAAGQVVWRLGHEVQLTADVGPSARSRLEAAEAALAALPPPVDARAVWEAQCAHLDAAALVNRLASSGLLVPPVPEHLLTAPLRSQATRFRNQLIARADRWSEPALSRAAALALLPAGGREAPGRSADARLTEAFLGLILARVALLEASARYARNMQDLEDSRRRQEELLEQGGMLLGELSAALSAPAAAGDGGASAGGGQDGRSPADRAAERMALQLSRVAFLQAAKPFAGHAELGNYRAVRRQQEALLDEVQALAAEVEGAHNRSDPQPSGPANPDTPEGPVGRVRRLAERAAEWREQLRRSGELRDIVEAMARGDLRGGFSTTLHTRVLAGHLYRCANGHVYMVGECGSPEADATCPECGAPIGYGSRNARVQLTDAVLG